LKEEDIEKARLENNLKNGVFTKDMLLSLLTSMGYERFSVLVALMAIDVDGKATVTDDELCKILKMPKNRMIIARKWLEKNGALRVKKSEKVFVDKHVVSLDGKKVTLEFTEEEVMRELNTGKYVPDNADLKISNGDMDEATLINFLKLKAREKLGVTIGELSPIV
jgi:hypothetical protein